MYFRPAIALSALCAPALAQERFPATLEAHAELPGDTFIAAPDDAPPMFSVSGRFTGEEGRTETLGAITDEATGLSRPFEGQPVQGFSGIRSLGDDRFLVLTDNGFGAKANSADALLMFHEVDIDWASGEVVVDRTTFLSDPDRVVPFPITTEATGTRYLTGADFDLESIQPVGEGYWIGDEFGPWLIELDAGGVVQRVVATEPGGRLHRSPDHPRARTPDPGDELPEDVIAMRSGGYEGMALGEDGTTLYPLLEKPVWDAAAGAPMTVDGRPVLSLFEFDIAYIDLLDIDDPRGIGRGTESGTFTFPFVTIENVDRVDEDTIVVANDNNYPFSVGREAGRADDNEFILLNVAAFLAAE